MGGNCRASFFSVYLAPTSSIAVGRSVPVSASGISSGSELGGDQIERKSSVLWGQRSEIKYQASSQRAEEEGGIWGTVLDWFKDQFDSFLKSITEIFAKEFWDLKTSISDSLSKTFNGFWNKLTGTFDTQKGILIKLQTETQLQTTKLNDMLYFFTNKSNDSGLLFNLKAIVTSGTIISNNLSAIKSFMTNEFSSSGLLWHLKIISGNSTGILSWLSKINGFLTNNFNSSGLLWHLKIISDNSTGVSGWLSKINGFLTNNFNSSGLLWHLKIISDNSTGISSWLFKINGFLTGSTNDSGLLWYLKKDSRNIEGIVTHLAKINEFLFTSINSTGLLWYLKRSDRFLSDIVNNLNNILTAVKAIKPSSVGYTLADLEKMLKKVLKSVKIVDEAGTNVWDVLKEAIKSGFDLLGKSVETLGGTIGKILDFLDSFLDKIIKLIVPDSFEFFEKEMDSVKAETDQKIKPVTDITGRFMDALNVNKQSRRLARGGSDGIFGKTLEDSLRFKLLGTEVDFTPIPDVFNGIKKLRMALSIFIIGFTGFALKKRLRGKEGLTE